MARCRISVDADQTVGSMCKEIKAMEIDAVIESVHQRYPNLRIALRWNLA
jgi:hypothetical protein